MPSLGEVQYTAAKMQGGQADALGYQQITDLSSSTTLTVPSGSTLAVIQCTAQNVRWRDDGTAPTATVGMQLAPGDYFFYTGELSNIRFIEEAASAVLNISYFGAGT